MNGTGDAEGISHADRQPTKDGEHNAGSLPLHGR